MKKKLQIAMDLFHIEEAIKILDEVADYVDIIEVGSPLGISEGAAAIKSLRERYPDKFIFSDIKVMDGGGEVPVSVIKAGCDMFSVLGVADDNTIKAAVQLAKENNVKVLVDMCNVIDMEARALEIEKLGPDYLCCHVAYDVQDTGVDPIEELRRLEVSKLPKAIAGGIKLSTFEKAVNSSAEIIICGAGLVQQENRKEIAIQMRAILDTYNQNNNKN